MGEFDDLIPADNEFSDLVKSKSGPTNWKEYMAGMAKKEMGNASGPMGKTWAALKFAKPAAQVLENTKSALVGKTMNDVVGEPSGDVVNDVMLNTPRIAQETVGEVAPDMYASRPALAMGGAVQALKAAAPVINPVGRWIGDMAEKASGLGYKNEGVLARTVADPSLPIGKGVDSVYKDYEAAKGGVNAIRQGFREIPDELDLVKSALEAAKNGSLTSQEALEARKALDASKNRVSSLFYGSAREILNDIAKKDFAGPDAAWQRALDSEALRNAFAINKSGSPSIVKGTLAYIKPGLKYLLSPAIQGAAASGVGLARQTTTPQAMAIPSIIDKIKELMAMRK